MPKTPVRVRLAPSPTGEVHIGTIWIGLFNSLFARQLGGKVILRIEDTDQKRFVEGSTERIFDALQWYGIDIDEGPIQGGAYGPYIQSQRLDLYQQHAQQLIDSGHAYYCFCTAERLTQLRAEQAENKQPPKYDKRCASLNPIDAKARVAAGEAVVIRMNLPSTGTIETHDLIRDTVTFQYGLLDDSVLLKTDGFPTYHLAVVVDDHLMEISHVIRAEEWLPSLPKHLWLYQAFGWTPPIFAHLPLILDPDRKKMSKRHGATSALSFRDEGYLPEAMRNFLALMGWHPKGDEEIFSEDALLKQFDLGGVNPSGAIFDRVKLDWMNGEYIRRQSANQLYALIQPFLHPPLKKLGDAIQPALPLINERIKKLSEINELLSWLAGTEWDNIVRHLDRDRLVPKKGTSERTQQALGQAKQYFEAFHETWSAADLKKYFLAKIKTDGWTNMEMLWPLRMALTLQEASPDIFDVAAVLGRDETLRRISAINA